MREVELIMTFTLTGMELLACFVLGLIVVLAVMAVRFGGLDKVVAGLLAGSAAVAIIYGIDTEQSIVCLIATMIIATMMASIMRNYQGKE